MEVTSGEVVDALRDVYDPCCQEKGLSVVDMGLVRTASVAGGRAASSCC